MVGLALEWLRGELLRNLTVAVIGAIAGSLTAALLAARARGLLSPAWVAMGIPLVPTGLSVVFSQDLRVSQTQLPWLLPLPALFLRRTLLAAVTVGAVAAILAVAWLAARSRGSAASAGSGGRLAPKRLGVAGAATAAACLLLTYLALRLFPSPLAAKPYSVIYLSWDSVRADFVSAYGYPRPTTPNLDRLAAEGVLFERAVAQYNWTRPSYASILTSRYAGRHALPMREEPNLAELLRHHRYRTVAFVQNPQLDARFGFSDGFDEYHQVYEPGTPQALNGYAVPRLRELLRRETPFLLFVQYLDPHWPYPGSEDACGPPPAAVDPYELMKRRSSPGGLSAPEIESVVEHLRCGYEVELGAADRALGEMLAVVRESDALDRVLIAFNSDHGEEFFDHGRFGHQHANLHPELTFVPLVIRFPDGTLEQPARVSATVRNLDLLPTLLEVVGIAPPPGMEGRSLVRWREIGATERSAPSLFMDGFAAMRQGSRSVLVSVDSEPRVTFFDLATDPTEHHPLDPDRADPAFEELARETERWMVERERSLGGSTIAPTLSEAAQERLRALGYAE
jgi:arylsulfatase A-like enzyme